MNHGERQEPISPETTLNAFKFVLKWQAEKMSGPGARLCEADDKAYHTHSTGAHLRSD